MSIQNIIISWFENLQIINSILIPIILLLTGYIINRRLKRLEDQLVVNRELRERRFKDFDELTSSLNDIFCYCTYVGHWQEITPIKALETKRKVDKLVYQSLPIWNTKFLIAYRKFIKVCFKEYSGRNQSVHFRADINRHREAWKQNWRSQWDNYFLPDDKRFDSLLRYQAYQSLLLEKQKLLHRAVFFIFPKMFYRQVRAADLSYRRHLVQPAYAELISVIGDNIGVPIDTREILATWKPNTDL